MTRMPVVSGADVVRALLELGFEHRSQRGSHVKLDHEDGRVVIVPAHKTLRRGTLSSILRQAHITVDELVDLL